jgi:hypothetical protein
LLLLTLLVVLYFWNHCAGIKVHFIVKKHWFATSQPKRMNLETKSNIGSGRLSEFYIYSTFLILDSPFGLAAGYRLDG